MSVLGGRNRFVCDASGQDFASTIVVKNNRFINSAAGQESSKHLEGSFLNNRSSRGEDLLGPGILVKLPRRV